MTLLPDRSSVAVVGGWTARELDRVSTNISDLSGGGRWAVSVSFEGTAVLAKFRDWSKRPLEDHEVGGYIAPKGEWADSLPRTEYMGAVARVREQIARGEVYQVNVCRILSNQIDSESDPAALWRNIANDHPSPYGGILRLPGFSVVSASPELFLRRRGDRIASGPIKGTADRADGFTEKDQAENVMIVDLVRNDLGRICETGSVTVPQLMVVEEHPGLFHLVSNIEGALVSDASWENIFEALFPAGSVTGAPKLAALDSIRTLEPAARGPYCGAFGWIDADNGTAELAVAIRTFWFEHDQIRFGTGAGITWGSDPAAEWRETELKAQRLMALAGQSYPT